MSRPFRPCWLLFVGLLAAGCGPGGKPSAGGGGDTVKREPVYEPLPDHQLAELSNLRFGRGDLGKEKFEVDWKITRQRQGNVAWGMTLLIRPTGRPEITMTLSDRGKDSGKMSGEMVLSNVGEAVLEKGCEMFLVIPSGSTRYKISNSLTVGGATESQPLPAPPR